MVLLLTNDEVEQILSLDVCVKALEEAYKELGRGAAVNRPRTHTHLPTSSPERFYRFKSMEGGLSSSGVYALRIASDIVAFPTIDGVRRQRKIPAALGGYYLGLVLLFSSENGDLLAILPDGVIQGMRVGATSAIAARHLSREDASRVGMIGSGWQARWFLRALSVVRRLKTVKVYSPSADHSRRFAEEMGRPLDVDIQPALTAEAAVKAVDIVVTATDSIHPVLRWEWIEPGVHVGSTTQREIDDQTLKQADILVVNSRAGGGADSLAGNVPGEKLVLLSKLHEERPVDWTQVPDLSELLTGKVNGRTEAGQVTVFLNNIGLGFQFAALGAKLHQLARQRGIGRTLPLEWFVEAVHP